MLAPDSPLVPRVVPSLGVVRGVYEPRLRPAEAVVVHTTGIGPVRRVLDPKFAKWRERTGIHDPFEAALWIYRVAMRAGPHYVVDGETGRRVQVCPENLCAWHVGGRGGGRYRHDFDRWANLDTAWWIEEWPTLTSPRDLAGGRLWLPYGARTSAWVALHSLGGSVNANTYGIEVVPCLSDPRGPWTDAGWTSLVELVGDICLRRDVPCMRDRVIRHSDAHPLKRSARGAPWDPSPVQFTWGEFSGRSGAPF
jgi:hypothetical protein